MEQAASVNIKVGFQLQSHRIRTYLMTVLCVVAGVASLPAQAQFTKPAANAKSLAGNTWDSIKQLPDLYTGVWEPRFDPAAANAVAGGGQYQLKMSLTPEYQKKLAAIKALADSGGDIPSASKHCIAAFGGAMAGPELVMSFSYTPGRVVIAQSYGAARHIYLDGRPLPQDPDESFQGFSIGHWQGKTLVVETVGLDRNNEFIDAVAGGVGMHVLERMTLTAPNELTIESTLTAPQALTEPLKRTTVFVRHPDWPMIPYDCQQNNRSVDANGRQQFDLTPPH